MRKPVVGDTLFLIDHGYHRMYGRSPKKRDTEDCKVTAVKRKWFTVQPKNRTFDIVFSIETWREKGGCVPRYTLYESEQAWKDIKEASYIKGVFCYAFSTIRAISPSLKDLKKAAKILKLSLKPSSIFFPRE